MRKYSISETYDIVTEESAENGETAENGFYIEEEYWTAQEIADYLRNNLTEFLCGAGANGGWFSTYPETDYRTGDTETHYFHINDPMSERLLEAIMRSARI